MNNRKKLNIINFIIYAVILALAVLALVLKNNQTLLYIFISLVVVLLVLSFIIDRKIKALDKEKEAILDKEYEQEKQKAFAYVEEKASEDERFSLMNSLIKHEIIEIDSLVKKYNLQYDFDMIFEDNYFDFMIEGDISKRKRFYISFSTEKNEWTLILNRADKERRLINESNEEIIELIVNDIKNTFNND